MLVLNCIVHHSAGVLSLNYLLFFYFSIVSNVYIVYIEPSLYLDQRVAINGKDNCSWRWKTQTQT